MPISERINNWIEDRRQAWGEALGIFLLGVIGKGVTKFFEDREPETIATMRASLKKYRELPNIPPDMRDMIDRALATGDIMPVLNGWAMTLFGFLPQLLGLGAPLGRHWGYTQDRVIQSYRLDPLSIITAWRREPEKYQTYFEDLKDQGWSADRLEALKFLTQVMPSPRDYVGFLAHEVFEADMIAKYGLLSEWDVIDKEPAKKIGLEEDILKLYWMDHWEHPEWGTIKELRHRDQITDQDVKDWFRLVEIPEYWRPKMLEVMWGLPNRIEIRMMARYLDMSKADIEALLKKAGLHEDFRSDAADFMMIMGLTGYWADMLRNGWMSPEEVKEDIDSRGFKEVTGDRIYKRLVKAAKPAQMEDAKKVTQTSIIKWVREDSVARWEPGIDLLMDLGYDEAGARFTLGAYIAELGSPETYQEWKDLTQKWRKASGMEAKAMPEELQKAAAELVKVTQEVESLQEAIAKEEATLIPDEALPEEATERLAELRVTLHRAEAELARLQTDYNIMVAEWRHKEG